MIKSGIEYLGPENFSVVYNSPGRHIHDLREEFNNDAKELSRQHGPVYIGFSSGVDSQIITRCFLDMKLDAEYVFLYIKGYNEKEYMQVIECEKFYGIKVCVIELDIEQHKNTWIADNKQNPVNSLIQYPFHYLSSVLKENWPIVTQGKMEPSVVGTYKGNVSITHNY